MQAIVDRQAKPDLLRIKGLYIKWMGITMFLWMAVKRKIEKAAVHVLK